MGHLNLKITMDRYGHLLPEVHEQGVKALDVLFKSNNTETKALASRSFC